MMESTTSLIKQWLKGLVGIRFVVLARSVAFIIGSRRDGVYDHLIAFGFLDGYDEWIFHGEEPSKMYSMTCGNGENISEGSNVARCCESIEIGRGRRGRVIPRWKSKGDNEVNDENSSSECTKSSRIPAKDNEKQVVEKEKEQENQTQMRCRSEMLTIRYLDQVLCIAIFGELRIDGHERDGGKKRKRMSKRDQTRMEELQSQQNGKSGEDAESSCSVDPFLAVMGKEHNGRVRLHGRGVTPSSLGKASAGNGSSSINVPDELLESIKADVAA
ncbi:hypothetical protein Dimus_036520 [Dionaea muscipula]